jgi:multicomponent Na+:H+ antiporter subunit E
MRGRVLSGVLLALAYAALLPEVAVPDLVLAGALSGSVLFAVVPPWPGTGLQAASGPAAVASVVALAGIVFAHAVRGGWSITRMTLNLGDLPLPGVVEIPFGERSLRGAAVNGLIVTLSPGTLLLDVDEERRLLHFHVAGEQRADFARTLDRIYRHQKTFLP